MFGISLRRSTNFTDYVPAASAYIMHGWHCLIQRKFSSRSRCFLFMNSCFKCSYSISSSPSWSWRFNHWKYIKHILHTFYLIFHGGLSEGTQPRETRDEKCFWSWQSFSSDWLIKLRFPSISPYYIIHLTLSLVFPQKLFRCFCFLVGVEIV